MEAATSKAYGLLAEAIALHTYKIAELEDPALRAKFDGRSVAYPICYHNFMSTFEATMSALTRLKILKPIELSCFVFTCELTDCRGLAELNMQAGPSFGELLEAFVGLFGEFGTSYWGFETALDVPFSGRNELVPALESLAALGYVRRIEGKFFWTERITPTMTATGFWAPKGDPS